jgi:hypothetical protein
MMIDFNDVDAVTNDIHTMLYLIVTFNKLVKLAPYESMALGWSPTRTKTTGETQNLLTCRIFAFKKGGHN